MPEADRRRFAAVEGAARADHGESPGLLLRRPRAMAMGSSTSPQDRLLGYHPIVLGDQVVVCDSSRVLAFNLNDRPGGREGGPPLAIEPAWKHDPESAVTQAYRATGIPRYTLTAVGNRIYARMGPPTPSAVRRHEPVADRPARAPSSRSTGRPRASCSGSSGPASWCCPTVRRIGSTGRSTSRGRRWPTAATCTWP